MQNRALCRGLSVLLLLVFPASTVLADATAAAMLHTSGPVMLNGAGAPQTAALFQGDTVQTTTGGSVTISFTGSTVLVPQNSRVIFRGDWLDVDTGTVVVSTSRGIAAQAASYRVSPVPDSAARFQLARLGDKILITAQRGALTVRGAGKLLTVSEGTTEILVDGPESQGPPPGAGKRSSAALSAAELLLIGGGVSVAAAVIALATAQKKPHPITPARP